MFYAFDARGAHASSNPLRSPGGGLAAELAGLAGYSQRTYSESKIELFKLGGSFLTYLGSLYSPPNFSSCVLLRRLKNSFWHLHRASKNSKLNFAVAHVLDISLSMNLWNSKHFLRNASLRLSAPRSSNPRLSTHSK